MKDDRVYLKHILRCIARIQEYTQGGRERFLVYRAVEHDVPTLKAACEAALAALEHRD